MSVLAGIEAEPAPTPGPSSGLPLGGLQAKTLSFRDAEQNNPSSLSLSVPESFRSNWQAQLASLVSDAAFAENSQIGVTAFSEPGQLNPGSNSTPSGNPKSPVPPFSASSSQAAGGALFRGNNAARMGSASAIDTSVPSLQAAPTQARVTVQAARAKQTKFEGQFPLNRDVHSMPGTSSPDSRGTQPVHAGKHQTLEPVSSDQPNALVLTSTLDGLHSASLTAPAPASSPTPTAPKPEAQTSHSDSTFAPFPDPNQSSSAHSSSVVTRSGAAILVANAHAGYGLHLLDKSTPPTDALPLPLSSSPDHIVPKADPESANPALAAASASVDSSIPAPTASRSRERASASPSLLGADKGASLDPSAELHSDEIGAEVGAGIDVDNLLRGQPGRTGATSVSTVPFASASAAHTGNPLPAFSAASESAAPSPVFAPLAPAASSGTRAVQPAVQGTAAPSIQAAAASAQPVSFIPLATSTSKAQHAPVPSVTANQPLAFGGDAPPPSTFAITQAQPSTSQGDASASGPAKAHTLEPKPPSSSSNADQQVPVQAQAEILPAESQSAAVSPTSSASQSEPGRSATPPSRPERLRAERVFANRTIEQLVASPNTHSSDAHPAPAVGVSPLQSQFVPVSSGDASSLVRDPAVPHGTSQTNTGASTGSTPSVVREAFAEIDNSVRPDAASWTHVGAHRAEAGIQDPGLGWIGVRADRSAGQIQATLVPGSSDAAQILGSHLAGLSAYLTNAHTHVTSLSIAQPEGQDAATRMGSGQGQGTGQSSDQGMSQNSGNNHSSDSSHNFNPTASATPVAVRTGPQVTTDRLSQPSGLAEFSGGHISVMA